MNKAATYAEIQSSLKETPLKTPGELKGEGDANLEIRFVTPGMAKTTDMNNTIPILQMGVASGLKEPPLKSQELKEEANMHKTNLGIRFRVAKTTNMNKKTPIPKTGVASGSKEPATTLQVGTPSGTE